MSSTIETEARNSILDGRAGATDKSGNPSTAVSAYTASVARVRFSVRWTGGYRAFLIGWLVFFTLLTAGWLFVTWNPAFTADAVDQEDRAGLWIARVLVILFVGACLALLGPIRFSIELDGDTLVRQAALGRRRVRLASASFAMTETSWDYTRRFGAANFAKIKVRAPTLVVRASRLRRIKLPLVQRAGHQVVGDRIMVAWLPQRELDALAAAIEEHATAPNRERVAHYLRNVSRSAVQPSGELGGVF